MNDKIEVLVYQRQQMALSALRLEIQSASAERISGLRQAPRVAYTAS